MLLLGEVQVSTIASVTHGDYKFFEVKLSTVCEARDETSQVLNRFYSVVLDT